MATTNWGRRYGLHEALVVFPRYRKYAYQIPIGHIFCKFITIYGKFHKLPSRRPVLKGLIQSYFDAALIYKNIE